MIPNTHPSLSKSRYMSGLQCLKRLYLESHRRDLADRVTPSQQAIFDSGTAVGELARQRFAGGRLVTEPYYEQTEAERTTRSLLADTSVQALFEPAFTFEGIRTRVDILRRSHGGAFDLIEVKSTTRQKDLHIPDIAVQLYAVEGCGVPIRRAYLMHINRNYIYKGGKHDLKDLFQLADVTALARAYLEDTLPHELSQMRQALKADQTPDVQTGRHCSIPYVCPFFGHCHAGEPEYPLRTLPNLNRPLEERMMSAGVADIGSIPAGFQGMSELQGRIQASFASGAPYVSANLAPNLATIGGPASFLDFEALSPAVPMYAGTRPYQAIPFQWSLHVRDANGKLTHHSFLYVGVEDPRDRFAESLLKSVPPAGPVVTYSSYEKTTLNRLAEVLPPHRSQLLKLNDRIVDLLPIIRNNYYHPEFKGSFSIKAVAPALVPDLDYEDLEIQEGNLAAAQYEQLVRGGVPKTEAPQIRASLLAYCARDTEAMVRVYEALMEAAAN